MKIIGGAILFASGLYLVSKESRPYEFGFLPNLLGGLGLILFVEGALPFIKRVFNKIKRIRYAKDP